MLYKSVFFSSLGQSAYSTAPKEEEVAAKKGQERRSEWGEKQCTDERGFKTKDKTKLIPALGRIKNNQWNHDKPKLGSVWLNRPSRLRRKNKVQEPKSVKNRRTETGYLYTVQTEGLWYSRT